VSIWTNRVMRRLRPGVAATLGSVAPFRDAWLAENERAMRGDGPLWVALGDSTAQGIGADAYDHGYVGRLRRLLDARDGRPWRVVNLSVTGARVRRVIAAQLPVLEQLAEPPQLVTCAAGANDLAWAPGISRLLVAMGELIERLPEGAVIATVPQGLGRGRTRRVNDLIRAEAPKRGLLVADVWAATGPPWSGKYAADGFHPNERGYEDWTRAFAAALGLG